MSRTDRPRKPIHTLTAGDPDGYAATYTNLNTSPGGARPSTLPLCPSPCPELDSLMGSHAYGGSSLWLADEPEKL